jgi:hypothetical protein
MDMNIASGDKKPSTMFLNLGKVLLDAPREWQVDAMKSMHNNTQIRPHSERKLDSQN